MKTNAYSIVNFSFLSVLAAALLVEPVLASSCDSPSPERASLCGDFAKAEQAIRDQNYGTARRTLNKLKSKVTLSDPLASEIAQLEASLPASSDESGSTPAPARKVEQSSPKKVERIESKDFRKDFEAASLFRKSDGFLKRKTWEMVNLYILEGIHAVHVGTAFTTFSRDNENQKLLFYMGTIGTAALTLGSTFFYDRIHENFRYGVPSGFAFGAYGGIGSGVAAAFLIHSIKKDGESGVGEIEDVYQRSLAIGSTVGGALLGTVAHFTELRPGQSAFIASSGLWGGGMGMSGAGMFVDPDKQFVRPLTGWGTAVGNIAGLAAGSALVYGLGFSPSTPRVLIMNAGYFGGLLSAFYIIGASTSERNNQRNRNLAIGSLTGGLVGLGAATLLTSWSAPDTRTLHAEGSQSKSWLDNLSLGIAPSDEGDLMAQATWRF